jgi:hypothetical protein
VKRVCSSRSPDEGMCWPVSRSVVQHGQIEFAEDLGVSNHIDCADLPARKRKAEGDARPSAWSPRQANSSIEECGLCGAGASGEGLGNVSRTLDLARCTHGHRRTIGADHNIVVKQRKKCVEVAAVRCGNEGIDDFALRVRSASRTAVPP